MGKDTLGMTMRQPLILLLTLATTATTLCAQVRFRPEDQSIRIDGNPFTPLHRGQDAAKPFSRHSLLPLEESSPGAFRWNGFTAKAAITFIIVDSGFRITM